jgi:hypothetical protein
MSKDWHRAARTRAQRRQRWHDVVTALAVTAVAALVFWLVPPAA